jgi:STE24 endopeptidase
MPALLLCSYLLTVFADFLLRLLNLRHLRRYGTDVPACFEGTVERETLSRATAYTLTQTRWQQAEALVNAALLLIFIFGGILARYDTLIASVTDSFVGRGVCFFAGLTLAQLILAIPFDLVQTFHVENRYGFNMTTFRLWMADLLKSTAIALVMVTVVSSGAFFLVESAPQFWWLWVWLFFAVISIFLMYLSPYCIEPLFFRFEPITEEGLEEEIRSIMERAGLKVGAVLQVDASRRSRHSNAYFTGIGRVKRIVIYDTLLEQMTHREVLAVLAHEVGHWKKGHVRKRLLVTELAALVTCWLAWRLVGWVGLPGLVGSDDVSFAARLVILGFIASLATFALTPAGNWLSRRHEYEADAWASDLTGDPEALASALVKLSRENLANLHPHPLYAGFYYSHPPVVERVRRLLGPDGRRDQSRPG